MPTRLITCNFTPLSHSDALAYAALSCVDKCYANVNYKTHQNTSSALGPLFHVNFPKSKNRRHILNYYTLNLNKNHPLVDISLHYVNLQLKQPLGLYLYVTFKIKALAAISHHIFTTNSPWAYLDNIFR